MVCPLVGESRWPQKSPPATATSGKADRLRDIVVLARIAPPALDVRPGIPGSPVLRRYAVTCSRSTPGLQSESGKLGTRINRANAHNGWGFPLPGTAVAKSRSFVIVSEIAGEERIVRTFRAGAVDSLLLPLRFVAQMNATCRSLPARPQQADAWCSATKLGIVRDCGQPPPSALSSRIRCRQRVASKGSGSFSEPLNWS